MNNEGNAPKRAQEKNISLGTLSVKLKQNYEFFASLSDDELLGFLRLCDSQQYWDGEIVFEEGEVERVWFVILSGRVLIPRGEKKISATWSKANASERSVS